jgi:hypothetical protein
MPPSEAKTPSFCRNCLRRILRQRGEIFSAHDLGSGTEFQANASLRAFNSPILIEIMSNLLLTFPKPSKSPRKP